VMDLSELEQTLNLTKDSKDPNGNWYRGDDKLKAGPCYQKLMAGADSASYELRRYGEGAAFFKKQGAGVASGSDRPILCLDVDAWYDDGTTKGVNQTLEVSGIELDAVLRYRIGRPTGGDGAAGTFYSEYQYGDVTTHGGYCPEGWDAAKPEGLSTYCFGRIQAPGMNQGDGGLQVLVYQYANKHAVSSNRYSMSSDPVGRFVRMEGDYENQILHFEKIDAKLTTKVSKSVNDPSGDILTLLSKDGAVLAKCDRTSVSTNENDFFKVECTGL